MRSGCRSARPGRSCRSSSSRCIARSSRASAARSSPRICGSAITRRDGIAGGDVLHLQLQPGAGRHRAVGIGGVLMTAVETTKRVWAERALREREAELARVQEIGQVGGVEVVLTTVSESALARVPEDSRASSGSCERDARRLGSPNPSGRPGKDERHSRAVRGDAANIGQSTASFVQATDRSAGSGAARSSATLKVRCARRGAHRHHRAQARRAGVAAAQRNARAAGRGAHARARPALARLGRSDRRREFRRALGQHQSRRHAILGWSERAARDADRLALASRRRRDHARASRRLIEGGRPSASRTAIATRTGAIAGSPGPRPRRAASSTRSGATSRPSARPPTRCGAPRSNCARRRRWKRSASSPAASRTISTIC